MTYSRVTKRPPVQLMTHDEALKHVLSTEQIREILAQVDKHQEINALFNSKKYEMKSQRKGKTFLTKLQKQLHCCESSTKTAIDPSSKKSSSPIKTELNSEPFENNEEVDNTAEKSKKSKKDKSAAK